jgi:hypothetical protein
MVDDAGTFRGDVIGLEGEILGGMPLLAPVMQDGKICCNQPPVRQIQRTTRENLARLPEPYKRLTDAHVYPVVKSRALEAKRLETEDVLKGMHRR